jgi:hypothetical protein
MEVKMKNELLIKIPKIDELLKETIVKATIDKYGKDFIIQI